MFATSSRGLHGGALRRPPRPYIMYDAAQCVDLRQAVRTAAAASTIYGLFCKECVANAIRAAWS